VVYASTGRFDAARRELEEALRLDPGLDVARQNLERLRHAADAAGE
jgi:Flp pilus assembly protein TadD